MDEMILDMHVVEEAKATMKEKFPVMVSYFLEDGESYIKTIRDGLARNDAGMVSAAAHTLKSLSLQLGAIKLGAAARQIEEIARTTKDIQEISVLVAETEKVFSRTSQVIKTL